MGLFPLQKGRVNKNFPDCCLVRAVFFGHLGNQNNILEQDGA